MIDESHNMHNRVFIEIKSTVCAAGCRLLREKLAAHFQISVPHTSFIIFATAS